VHGLKHNLLSISQLCDKGYRVIFESTHCMVVESSTNEVKFLGKRQGNVYVIHLDELFDNDICLVQIKMKIVGCGIEDWVMLA
jgi:hypothetical protein